MICSKEMTTTTTVYKWELWCETDSRYETVWLDKEPTQCPTNFVHTIATSPGPRVIAEVSNQTVSMQEEFTPTQGYYQSLGRELEVGGNVGEVTVLELTWPYRISLLNGWFYSTSDNVGDKIEAYVATDVITGAITGDVVVNDTVISVSPTVMENVAVGYHLKVFDGTNQSDLGRVVGIDRIHSQVTVETASDKAYSHHTPTYVKQTVKVIDDMFINLDRKKYSFADKKLGGKSLPPGVPLQVRYTNRTGGEKIFTYNMEYIY